MRKLTYHLDFVFIAIILTYIGINIFQVTTGEGIFTLQNYLSFGLFVLVTIFRIFNEKYGKIAVLLLLILGSVNLIKYSWNINTIFFGSSTSVQFGQPDFGKSLHTEATSIRFQVFSGRLLLIFLLGNIINIIDFFKKIISDSPEEVAKKEQKKTEYYYNNYKYLTIEELENMLKEFKTYSQFEREIFYRLIEEKTSCSNTEQKL
jgi:hypothetical protein